MKRIIIVVGIIIAVLVSYAVGSHHGKLEADGRREGYRLAEADTFHDAHWQMEIDYK